MLMHLPTYIHVKPAGDGRVVPPIEIDRARGQAGDEEC
jgi:hypothetical protein